MISACRALALSFSSSVILPLRRISPCFWLAMTFAACSLSRMCCDFASVIACSSCTFGSARSLNEPVSFAVRYFHHLRTSLNMPGMLVEPRPKRAADTSGPRVGSKCEPCVLASAPSAHRSRRCPGQGAKCERNVPRPARSVHSSVSTPARPPAIDHFESLADLTPPTSTQSAPIGARYQDGYSMSMPSAIASSVGVRARRFVIAWAFMSRAARPVATSIAVGSSSSSVTTRSKTPAAIASAE